jgi:Rrf2 family protein
MLTHRAKYALKALLYLARRTDETPVGAGVIAEAEHIPLKFLEVILTQLRNHGLIISKVGKGGGHRLGKSPREIDLLTVVRVIDGPVAPLPCLSQTAYHRCDDCPDEDACGVRRLLTAAHDQQLKFLAKTTLAQALDTGVPARKGR